MRGGRLVDLYANTIRPEASTMPQWIVRCSDCEKHFHYSDITPSSNPFGIIEKPHFPEDGLMLKCPHCEKTSNYQRYQLTFRND